MKELTDNLYDFEKIIRGGFLYIDKTEYIWKMIRTCSECFFFARPRRFGKSLLLSTLKAVFQGKRELFKGLALDAKPYDWQHYPVILLDLSTCQSDSAEELEKNLQACLANVAERQGISLRGDTAQIQFENLLFDVAKIAPPVLLVDEYDKPILGNICDKEGVRDILRKLKGFYAVIKKSSPFLRFVFITGVSKFCHVSVFSDLNNLRDISMNESFATMLGYTQDEFETYFAEYIAQTEAKQNLPHDEYLAEIKRWYDGFRFHAKAESVYNPVSLASFFLNNGEFNNYWFATGTPAFLIDLIKEQRFDFEKVLNKPVSNIDFSAYEVGKLYLLPLLFQTGYLTINHAQRNDGLTMFYLDFPNIEVKVAFDSYLINAYTQIRSGDIEIKVAFMRNYIKHNDVDGFMKCFQSLLAEIPYAVHIREEKYYQTVFFLIFLLLGVHIEAEAQTNNGRIDAVASYGEWVYIFEFKIDKNEEVAFEQIMEREYYKKYQYSSKKIVLIGANFSYEKRQLDGWQTKQMY